MGGKEGKREKVREISERGELSGKKRGGKEGKREKGQERSGRGKWAGKK